ncbi:hypothetical protein Tco_1072983, partial [Tanacetum coccineum]
KDVAELLRRQGMDIAKITRKRSKPDKHGHGNEKEVYKSQENAIKVINSQH